MKKIFPLVLFLNVFLVAGCVSKAPSGAIYHFSILSQQTSPAPRNFTEAKKAAWKIYAKHRKSFYCDCQFNSQGKIDPKTCHYIPTRINSRTYRIEWEHIVPAKVLGEKRLCWTKNICLKKDGTRYKGRACCTKIDQKFQQMEADLHNLVPAIGAINQARGTYPFGRVEKEVGNFMGCPLKISRVEKKVEPRDEIKGLIARTYLYISKKYDLSLPLSDKNLYNHWHHQYPPDEWEQEWNERVRIVQGDGNAYIKP